MPLWKCGSCHHEWEGVDTQVCAWCRSDRPHMLVEMTPLEKLIQQMMKEQKPPTGA